MSESNELLSAGAQLIGMPLAGPESFSAEQLAYLKRALGVDETVLFQDTSTAGTAIGSVVLSENASNFNKVEIIVGWVGGGTNPTPGRVVITCYPDGKGYGFAGYIGKDAATHNVIGGISTSGTSLTSINSLDIYTSNNSSITCQSFALKVYKVIGIGRIAGGN